MPATKSAPRPAKAGASKAATRAAPPTTPEGRFLAAWGELARRLKA